MALTNLAMGVFVEARPFARPPRAISADHRTKLAHPKARQQETCSPLSQLLAVFYAFAVLSNADKTKYLYNPVLPLLNHTSPPTAFLRTSQMFLVQVLVTVLFAISRRLLPLVLFYRVPGTSRQACLPPIPHQLRLNSSASVPNGRA